MNDNATDASAVEDEFGTMDSQPESTATADTEAEVSGQQEEDTSNSQSDEDDVVKGLLKSVGIENPDKIKYEADDGSIEERSWKDIPKQEKIAILSQRESKADPSKFLSDDEMNLIQQIRSQRVSPQQYLDQVAQYGASQVQPTKAYDVDNISDDELFVLDQLDRLGEDNVTDEQLQKMLEDAKSDEDLYNKTINALRNQYKEREDELNWQQQQEADMQKEQQYNNFSENILNEIKSLDNIAGKSVELSTDDMNDLANFILTRDENGNSEFGKAMNDPKTFTQMALWALRGHDILDEISSQIKMAYERGLRAGKNGQSSLTIKNNKDSKKPFNSRASKSAADLDFD